MKKYQLRKPVIGTVFNDKSILNYKEGMSTEAVKPHLLIDVEFLPDIVSSAPCTMVSEQLKINLLNQDIFNVDDFEGVTISAAEESPYHGLISDVFKKRCVDFKYFWLKKENDDYYVDRAVGKTIVSQIFKETLESIDNPDNQLIDIKEI
jgi:hypothetical protein